MFHYPARSGSTLLCQIFNLLPNTIVFSDTFTHVYLNKLFILGKVTKNRRKELMKDTMRLLMKPQTSVGVRYWSYSYLPNYCLFSTILRDWLSNVPHPLLLGTCSIYFPILSSCSALDTHLLVWILGLIGWRGRCLPQQSCKTIFNNILCKK